MSSENIEITLKDLPLSCPGPEDKEAWSEHPRVYLNLKNKRATCPYCGKKYLLKGDLPSAH